MKYSPRGRLELARRRHPGVTSGPWLVSEGGSRQVTVAVSLFVHDIFLVSDVRCRTLYHLCIYRFQLHFAMVSEVRQLELCRSQGLRWFGLPSFQLLQPPKAV